MTGQVPHGDRDHSEAPASVPLSEFRQQAGLPPAKDPDQERLDRYAEALYVSAGESVGRWVELSEPIRGYWRTYGAAALSLADAEQAELRAEVERLRVDASAAYVDGYDQGNVDGQADAAGEVESLRRWKAEATEVILGLQDVGKALGLRLGERITGTSAAEAAKRLTERAEKAEGAVARVEALADSWLKWPADFTLDAHGAAYTLKHHAAFEGAS